MVAVVVVQPSICIRCNKIPSWCYYNATQLVEVFILLLQLIVVLASVLTSSTTTAGIIISAD